ncbi:hypothetical protein ACH6CV_06355 [Bacillota bacterium Meth-B3]|nr:hypothetical protein [Christensenellaceae bacterium]MEA5069300.1 hypothetical protein [Christensenellaceae bacterium]
MAMMECAHCGEAAEARAMGCCSGCGAMVCSHCLEAQTCPEGPATDGGID